MEFSGNVDNGPREIALNLSKVLSSGGTLRSDLGLYPTLHPTLLQTELLSVLQVIGVLDLGVSHNL